MTFIRTLLGDIPPEHLGVCYAHEHIIIDASYVTQQHPEFLLDSTENGAKELQAFYQTGGRAMVDSMPCDCGRNVRKLAAVSSETGVHVVGATGAHLAKYYPDDHWSGRLDEVELALLFQADIRDGIDANDYAHAPVTRTPHRAGVIKIATQGIGLTDREQRLFAAAARASRDTGSPILTHVENGAGALEQITVLRDYGVNLNHVVLSHTDRHPDLSYHREILSSGVCLEYDSAFRWKEGNPTLDLLVALYPEFGGQLMLGMDAARRSYWRSYGGEPGLCYLLTTFRANMALRGLGADAFREIFVKNPAQAYAFAEPSC